MDYEKLVNSIFKFDPASRQITTQKHNRYILPSWLMFDVSDVPTGLYTIPAAGGAVPPVAWKQPYTSCNGLDAGFGQPFEIKYLILSDSSTGIAGANYEVYLKELGETRSFMNRACHVQTLFGTAQLPGRLREPYMFWSQHQIQAMFNNLDAGPRSFRAYLCGPQYYAWVPQPEDSREKLLELMRKRKMRQPYVWPYWLTTENPIDLAPGVEANFEMMVGQDCHFQAFSINVFSTGNFEWDLLEVKTGQQLSNGRVTKTNSLGDARLPTILPVPYLIPAGYRLRLTVKSLSGITNHIFFTIAGRRIYGRLIDVPQILCDTAVGE